MLFYENAALVARQEASFIELNVDGIRVLTSQPTLDGKQGDISGGGSGLDAWP